MLCVVQYSIHWYPFEHLGGGRLYESNVSCLRTQQNVPGVCFSPLDVMLHVHVNCSPAFNSLVPICTCEGRREEGGLTQEQNNHNVPGAHFPKAPETFEACNVVYLYLKTEMPETSCMKGTSVHTGH